MFLKKRRIVITGLLAVLIIGSTGLYMAIHDNSPGVVQGDGSYDTEGMYTETMKRINPRQYRNIIRDVFGPTIEVAGRFVETEQREEGLLAVGAARVSVTSMGFEAAEAMARIIASQVVSPQSRGELIACKPAVDTAFDTACAKQFIGDVGLLLYRRPLSDAELQLQMAVASAETKAKQDFYAGLERSLAMMLVSPNFLFRIEQLEADPDHSGAYRLTAWSKASRLSFLLWNSTPDRDLLQAAATGELHTAKALQGQVDRLLRSPRLQDGVRAFFSDMMAFDRFDSLAKDRQIYPRFTSQVAEDAREQTLRTLVDHLLFREADYRDIFISRKTFLTPSLAALFSMPLVQDIPYGAPDKWVTYEFPEGDPRAGILAQPSFVALHAHAGRTSPTNRGKALRENLLCQEVPPPPAAVDFNIVEDTSNPDFKTMRQRLSAHATMPTCAGCHKITDPIGLALETFDGDGSYRTTENGVTIDTSGEIDGVEYDDATGLGRALRNNPNVVSCVVNRVFSYGIGREIKPADRKWLKSVQKDFAKNGHKFVGLLQRIATSDEFYRGHVSEPELAAGKANNIALAAN